jgi:hypothetical protein
MSDKYSIWCAHPYHGEVLPNGKKRFFKIGQKPSHPKGKRPIKQQLAEFINNYHQGILNGLSKKLAQGDYLCSSCFEKEENHLIFDEEASMDIGNSRSSLNHDNVNSDSDSEQNYPMNDDYIRVEQEEAKSKLNEVFQHVNVKKIDDM